MDMHVLDMHVLDMHVDDMYVCMYTDTHVSRHGHARTRIRFKSLRTEAGAVA